MATSTQLTKKILEQPDPKKATFNIWKKTRYLVAQLPASDDYTESKPSYYQGRFVIPGPMANPKLSDMLGIPTTNMRDFELMCNRYHIRFVDNRTTDNADESVRRALFTVMSNEEADAYERALKEYYDNRNKRISSTPA